LRWLSFAGGSFRHWLILPCRFATLRLRSVSATE
jgi:hypothetical protein